MTETPTICALQMSQGQTDPCRLCGDMEATKRELYYYSAQDRLDPQYRPRLTSDERCVLQSGFNTICENRGDCRKRYKASISKV